MQFVLIAKKSVSRQIVMTVSLRKERDGSRYTRVVNEIDSREQQRRKKRSGRKSGSKEGNLEYMHGLSEVRWVRHPRFMHIRTTGF